MTSPPSHRDPAPTLRASDADRERVAEALRRHHIDGRLDTDELQERLERCYAARTAADLAPLLADLPSDERVRAPRPGRRGPTRPRLPAVALVVLLAIATAGALAHGHPGPLPFLAAFLVLRFVLWRGPRRRAAWGARV